jgi:hypothetical protein
MSETMVHPCSVGGQIIAVDRWMDVITDIDKVPVSEQ